MIKTYKKNLYHNTQHDLALSIYNNIYPIFKKLKNKPIFIPMVVEQALKLGYHEPLLKLVITDVKPVWYCVLLNRFNLYRNYNIPNSIILAAIQSIKDTDEIIINTKGYLINLPTNVEYLEITLQKQYAALQFVPKVPIMRAIIMYAFVILFACSIYAATFFWPMKTLLFINNKNMQNMYIQSRPSRVEHHGTRIK